VVKKPAMLNQTIRRRILFTCGSGALSTTAPALGFVPDFAAGGAPFSGLVTTEDFGSLSTMQTLQ
jgi:hypothetical protein